MSNKKQKNKKRTNINKDAIKAQIQKLKALKSKCRQRMTAARLRTMKGFEHLSDEAAKKMIGHMEEYMSIVLKQINRLQTNNMESYE